uniref:Uncharacterized protein n=1 Tax=Takifugu rubripes TaxID=31033 RepID=A0A3B5K5P2_TAKRU
GACVPGNVPCVPENVPCVPGNVPCVPQNVPCVPGNVPCVPGNVPCVPENVPCAPENVPCVPGNVPCVPGNAGVGGLWAPSQTKSLFWTCSLWSSGADGSQEQRGNAAVLLPLWTQTDAGRTTPETGRWTETPRGTLASGSITHNALCHQDGRVC